MNNAANRQTKKVVELAHPFGVASGKIIVDRNHMHTLAAQGIQIGWQGRDQGLPFTGLHLGNFAVVQHHAANHLHIEVAHPKHPLTRFAHHRESLGQQVV